MFNIGDIVSVQTEMVGGYPHAQNSIGGLFPVNRRYYEIVAVIDADLYIIGIGNLAIAAVRGDALTSEDVGSAWMPVNICGKVHIRAGARNYMGYPLPGYVYAQEYTVTSIVCDRVLLSGGDYTVAVKGEDVV